MKKNLLYMAFAAAALIGTGCAKTVEEGANVANQRYLDAWMQLNEPGIEPTGLGIYILEEKEGTEETTVGTDGFVSVKYRITDLEGNITSYTDKEDAVQLGEYAETNYYGAKFWTTSDGSILRGVQEIVKGMKVGGRKKAIIPSWLMSYETYGTEAEYLKTATDYSNTIYEVEVCDYTTDIAQWQIDSIGRYIVKNYGSMDAFSNDTTGFYYHRVTEPVNTKDFPSDTTIYINYTGRLLNGLVFDTNIERVAKDNGLYSSSNTYEPVSIEWDDSWSGLTMDSSTVIDGFALTLWQMHAMEKGIGIFYSNLGYGYSGSGNSIPAYAPLIFEIEIVEEPED